MSGHTPGPWRVEEIELFETGSGVQVVAADGTVIADNQTYYPQSLDPANAHLIAAAPELLEALKAMSHVEARDPGHVESIRAFSLARAAIAKAEGK